MKTAVIYGGGGHARVVMDCLAAMGVTVVGIVDDNPDLRLVAGIPVTYGYQPSLFAEHPFMLAVGDNTARKRLAQLVIHPFASTVHPSASVSTLTEVGEGTAIFHRAVVQTGSVLGQHVIVNTGAIVDHDCILADFVHIAPSATLCGAVTVGEGSLIGAGATVVPGISIGKWCVIGAGAVVTQSIPDFSVAVGVPARLKKQTHEP